MPTHKNKYKYKLNTKRLFYKIALTAKFLT